MTIIFSQTSDGQTISPGAGLFTGHVRWSRHDTVIQGAGIDVTTIKPDGQDARVFHAPSLIDGEPCRKATIRDLTIDCDRLDTLTAAVLCNDSAGNPLGPLDLVMERVKVANHHGGTIGILTGRYGNLRDVEIVGNGGGVLIGSSSRPGLGCRIRGLNVTGCKYVAQVTEMADGSVGVVPGVDIEDAHGIHYYWANPVVGETMTPVAFGALYVDVEEHNTDHRSARDVLRVLTPVKTYTIGEPLTGVEKWDRIETDAGEWTQVLDVMGGEATLDTWRDTGYWTPISEPSGTATVYRVTLGMVQSWTDTRIGLTASGTPADARWRTVENDDAPTPTAAAGVRLDVIRAASGLSSSIRDVNIQPIHITKAAYAVRVSNCTVTGSFADAFSMRGKNGSMVDCVAKLGQDMGFTVDVREGPCALHRCISRGTGVAGFTIFGSHRARLYGCEAYDSGFYSSTSAGWGARADSAAAGSYVEVAGSGNRQGLANEHVSVRSPRVFPRRSASPEAARIVATRTATRRTVVPVARRITG